MPQCETIDVAMRRLEEAAGPTGGLGAVKVKVTAPPERIITSGTLLHLMRTTGLLLIGSGSPPGLLPEASGAAQVEFTVRRSQLESVQQAVRNWLGPLMEQGCKVEI